MLGILTGLGLYHGLDPTIRTVIGTGGMGAYTTFSTFTFETVRLAEEGAINEALRNAAASFLVGLAAASAGLALAAVICRHGARTDRTADREPRPRPTWRGAAFAAAYGAIVATIGYVIGRGDLVVALLVMVAIGVLFRVWAYLRLRRAGHERPPGWKWL